MGTLTLLLLGASCVGALAYLPAAKEHFLSDSLLREVVDRMGRDLADAYLDLPLPLTDMGGGGQRLSMSRADKELQENSAEQADYQDGPASPSLRDQEYLQHSSLWAHQYMSGGAGEGEQRLKPDGAFKNQKQVKTDAALPAYCNPPNPCPVGYSGAEDGCLDQFENTAAFSRDYQSAQDCMCDSEHMFDCSRSQELSESELDRIVHQFQVEDQHKNLVAKKFQMKKSANPFLLGEKLPVAAKKGNNVGY